MTSEEKLDDIQRQCAEMWEDGAEKSISCPYCLHVVNPGEGPCCKLLDKAIRAIIYRARSVAAGFKAYESRSIRREIMGKPYVN